jgi:hypothetical protein
LQTRELVQHLFARHGGGLAEKLAEIRHHNVTSRARHGLPGGSTGSPDCAFLYLLVKTFQRRSIFEVGTYVGTSAVAMSMAGGHVVTCDPEDYGCLPSGIRFMHMPDDEACSVLRREGASIDMVFADWVPSADAVSLINELSTPDFIFTAHDYGPGDKGEVCFHLISEKYRRASECTWILPEAAPIEVIPGLLIEQATAALIPNRLLASL